MLSCEYQALTSIVVVHRSLDFDFIIADRSPPPTPMLCAVQARHAPDLCDLYDLARAAEWEANNLHDLADVR